MAVLVLACIMHAILWVNMDGVQISVSPAICMYTTPGKGWFVLEKDGTGRIYSGVGIKFTFLNALVVQACANGIFVALHIILGTHKINHKLSCRRQRFTQVTTSSLKVSFFKF